MYTLPSGDQVSKDDLVIDRGAWYPFSIGQQSCAGKSIALLELRVLLIALLRQFDIEVAEGYDIEAYEKGLMDVYVTLRGPLRVKLRQSSSFH